MLTVAKASAGAGKTFLLAKTYIDMLFAAKGHNRHRHILAVTFTKKATAEMKRRIIAELGLLATGAPSGYHDYLADTYALDDTALQQRAQSVLYDLLQDYSAFMVTTIDSFFQQIIRAFARELNLSGSYNLELDNCHILRTAVDDFFFNLPADAADPAVQVLLQIVEEKLADGKNWNPEDSLLSLSNELLKEAYQAHSAELERLLADKSVLSAYRQQLRGLTAGYMERYRALEQQLLTLLHTCQATEADFSYGKQTFAPFHWNKAKILTDYAKLPVRFLKFCDDPAAFGKKLPASLVGEAGVLAVQLRRLLTEEPLRQMLSVEAVTEQLPYLNLLSDISRFIAEANRRLNRLPIAETNALLGRVIGTDNDTPFVYDKIGTRIWHYLIDEFQDTSAAQWSNFRPLVRESLSTGHADLVVGDVKQSIYRFRNSDYSLLQSGIFSDFPRALPCPMTDNWRSDRIVVETNNRLFTALAEAADKEFCQLSADRFPALGHKIREVYAALEQTPRKTGEDGYVRFEFLQADTDAERRRQALERLLVLLEDLRRRHIPLGRVAVLVRFNNEAAPVAAALTAAGYHVLSNEGLLLASAPQVRFVIAVLQWLLSPADRLLRLRVLHEYALSCGRDADVALREALAGCDGASQQEWWNRLGQLAELPLYDLVQQLVTRFRLDAADTAKPYVQGLQDTVYNYVRRYQADLFSFLDWWSEKADSLAVAMQADDDAIQILSVHKSKGLEYDVVIVPFCDWPKAASQRGNRLNILWARPVEEPFAGDGKVPLLPLRFSRKLADTVFAEDYWREVQNLYIDNLNVTYVAFTRAKRELHVFAPSSEKVDSKGNVGQDTSTMGALLHSLLRDNVSADGVYEQGRQVSCPPVEAAVVQTEGTERLSSPLAGRLNVKRSSFNAFLRERPADLSSRLNLGILMHGLLCEVVRKGDEQAAMDALLRRGEITPSDLPLLEEEFVRFWRLVEPTDWFTGTWRVLNERDILLPDGTARRPDRLMLRDGEAVIVDYKFGAAEREEYTAQVRDYMRLLSSMGYRVRGYLCYVNQDLIHEVCLQ